MKTLIKLTPYNKYSNKKTTIDNQVFSSKREAKRYQELKFLERAKEISNLSLQPAYTLQDPFTDATGKKYRAVTYIADFSYNNKKGQVVIEDAKGMKTEVYQLKKKLFLHKYPRIIFFEV